VEIGSRRTNDFLGDANYAATSKTTSLARIHLTAGRDLSPVEVGNGGVIDMESKKDVFVETGVV
jgi:hypothetical protein